MAKSITPEEREALLSERRGYEQLLAASDYKAIKHSEGLISDDEYAPIKTERQSLRDKINEIDGKLKDE